jgi:SP family xylose:H+ symportor-like MFS transporter
LLSVLQQVTGINVFLYYAPEIFKQMGSGSDAALLQTIFVGAVNLVFTLIAIYTVDKFGRKPLMVIGSAGMGLCITAIGFAAFYQDTGIWLLAFILGYIAFFAMSLGPVTWVLLSEVFPNRVRDIALSIAVAAQWISNFLVSQSFPIMMENETLLENFNGAFPFWVFGGMCLVSVLFNWKIVPETKGKSLEEMEKLWYRTPVNQPDTKKEAVDNF